MSSIWSSVLWLYQVITGAIAANITINGAINVLSDAYVNGTVNTVDLAATGNAGITGHLTAATLDIPAGGYLDASGVGCLAYLPPTTMYGPLSFGSRGRVAPRVQRNAAAVGLTASPLVANFYQYTSAAAGSTTTLDESAEVISGDWIEITNNSATNSVTVHYGAQVSILKNASGFARTAKFVRDVGVWQLFSEIMAR